MKWRPEDIKIFKQGKFNQQGNKRDFIKIFVKLSAGYKKFHNFIENLTVKDS